MSTSAIAPEAPYDGSRIAQTLASFRSASGLDLAFGGPVRGDGTAIDELIASVGETLVGRI